MHAWSPYMKQKDKLTLHQNFEQTYRLEYSRDACMVTVYERKEVINQHRIKFRANLQAGV